MFRRFFDGVGHWADWYDQAKLAKLVDGLFAVERFVYITEDQRYAVARLAPC